MMFREALDRHLAAINNRDLAQLRDTVSLDGLLLITSDGRLVRTSDEFLDMHSKWFTNDAWSLEFQAVNIIESPELAVASLKLDYFERAARKPAIRETSYLTLAFGQSTGRWEMLLDQNTPCRNANA